MTEAGRPCPVAGRASEVAPGFESGCGVAGGRVAGTGSSSGFCALAEKASAPRRRRIVFMPDASSTSAATRHAK